MDTRRRLSRKEIFGWAMFDFANSSYTTVIITVVFSVIFPRIIVGDAPDFKQGNLMWSLSLSISNLIVLLTAPLLGAMTDYSASKKKFLGGSTAVTVIFTSALYFINPGMVIPCMTLIVISNIGFSYSEAFVSSFLPSLGPADDLGKISGYAWGLGYFGGLASTAIVIFGLGPISHQNFSNLKFVGPVTGIFFLLASIPTFLWVREPKSNITFSAEKGVFFTGFRRLKQTILEARDYRDLIILMLSFLLSYAGLSIVISFAFIYGDQIIKWDSGTQVLMFIITQFTAAGGALLFGIIQDRVGARITYGMTLVMWVVATTMIYGAPGITEAINASFNTSLQVQSVFLLIGCLAGLGLGATQSTCRAMVGIFSPRSKSGEFYGLWSMTSRLAAIFGLLGLGFLQTVFGLQKAILICSIFFLTALFVTFFIDEKRGKQSAAEHENI